MAKVSSNAVQHEGATTDIGVKRYNLVIPGALYKEVQAVAKEQHTSVLDLIRRFIVMGLMIMKVSQDPNASFLIRQNGKEREILFT